MGKARKYGRAWQDRELRQEGPREDRLSGPWRDPKSESKGEQDFEQERLKSRFRGYHSN